MLFVERQRDKNARGSASTPWRRIAVALLVFVQIVGPACSELEKPKSEPYYAETAPPRKQEFRWSNGRLPKSFDPARAATPPETDLVRALFEGLTELDPRTLKERPAAAESWTASDDLKTWTFHIRPDARWSNGRPLTGEDFVLSWKRLGQAGEAVVHRDLLKNIVGFPLRTKTAPRPIANVLVDPSPAHDLLRPEATPRNYEDHNSSPNVLPGPAPALFGVSAPDVRTVRVVLIAPDKDFPKLVAHPLFRPTFDGKEPGNTAGANLVTNGPFRLAAIDEGGVTLERSETYWNRNTVKLERVRFAAAESAEDALAAYKAGEIDAVTNADFEPLALKLLEPYEDFRRRTHAAINFYEVNHEKPPFDDRRVREALAISIERERLTEGEMEGLTQPALSFLPFGASPDAKIVQDKERARDLLADAGFAEGKYFPVIRLVINRNETQQRVARAVARMWKQVLNLETEIVVKESSELEAARIAGDFDLIRRGEVFPTADELMNILSILKPPGAAAESASPAPATGGVEALDPRTVTSPEPRATPIEAPDITMSEANALYELWAIPIYFPTSYSLVKPYVSGFEMNSLDAPVLSDVSIDPDWQPK